MKLSQFEKIMRKIIREEVNKAIDKKFTEILGENKKSDTEVINHGVNLVNTVSKPQKKQVYTKNPMLNDILNDVATTMPRSKLFELNGMDTMTMTSNDVSPITSTQKKGLGVKLPQAGDPEVQKNLNAVEKALNRDYSSLVKMFKKK